MEREYSSAGRARPCQGRGHEFEPRYSLQIGFTCNAEPDARVVELVDTRDLKSLVSNDVPVQVRPRAPLVLESIDASITQLIKRKGATFISFSRIKKQHGMRV